ncbi:uncharacterized protein LOC134685314 isoform X1 [Mytilus trossulus]|uniref:uncharacterized protein LOC134685314 isoform X1 n=1 Tax=Mytilus trossulus TaxID=6551 RepID=UPI0030068859
MQCCSKSCPYYFVCKLTKQFSSHIKFLCKNLSTSSRLENQQLKANKLPHQPENIVHKKLTLPVKFKSTDPHKVEDIAVQLNVQTISRHDASPSDPVVLALHGMPGDGGDFHNLSLQLAQHGINCIAPDFPGCGESRLPANEVYSIDYSPTGKADMLNRILDELKLERVDVLISHSAGSFLGFRAAAENDRIKSAVFLNFLGGKPHRYARPHNVIQFFARLMKNPRLQSFHTPLLPKFYELIGFARYDVQPLQVAIENVATAEFEKILDHVETIKNKKKPAMFCFATTDKLVELDIPYTILNHVGIKESDIINLCRENNIKEPSREITEETDKTLKEWYYKAVQFDRGGHLLQKTQIPELTKHIIDLLKYVHR